MTERRKGTYGHLVVLALSGFDDELRDELAAEFDHGHAWTDDDLRRVTKACTRLATAASRERTRRLRAAGTARDGYAGKETK